MGTSQASKPSGRAHKRIGITFLVTGGVLELVFRFIPDSEMNAVLWVISILAVPIILVGAFLFWRGRQYAALADAQRIISDSKPDVLYLRTFRSDPSTAGYVFSSILTNRLLSGLATEEEQLADVLRPFGDLVAIGQPGEALPKPGAARIYASDEEWKDVVKRQMQQARLVVIRAGVGENLLWELKQAVEILDPKKLLILVLNMKVNYYDSFRLKADLVLGTSLPEGFKLKRFRRVSGFIAFASDWTPTFLPLRGPYFRTGVVRPYQRLFMFALEAFFEKAGLEWQRPSISKAKVSAIVVLALFVPLVLYGIAVLIANSVGKTGGKGPPQAVVEQEPSREAFRSRTYLLQLASEVNKSLPMMVDKETELRSMSASEGAIIYNYVMVNYAAHEVDESRFLPSMRQQVESRACGEPSMKIFWENGVSAIYNYRGKDSQPIGEIIVTPQRCGFSAQRGH